MAVLRLESRKKQPGTRLLAKNKGVFGRPCGLLLFVSQGDSICYMMYLIPKRIRMAFVKELIGSPAEYQIITVPPA